MKSLIRALGHAGNLLAPTELIAFGEGLKDAAASHRYFSTLLDLFATGPVEKPFTAHAVAVAQLPAKGATHSDKWTIATFCAFLVQPDVYMFVKPGITKSASAALGFDIRYDARPNWRTYDAVLRMSRLYLEKLADLGARDFIDGQSFFWVTGENFERVHAAQRTKLNEDA